MFALTHVFIATEVAKKKTPLLVIGSIIPDFVWVSRKKVIYENLHNDIDGFYDFVQEKHEGLLDLALGMKLHSNKTGADLYSHFYKGGYSYTKGKALLPDLEKLVDSNNVADLSHTFIEIALDLHLLNDKPELLALYKKPLKEVDFRKISELFSSYSKVDKALIFRDIQALFELIKPENLKSKESFSKNVLPKLVEIGFRKRVEKKEVLRILEKALKLTESSYKDELDMTVSLMIKDFSSLL